METVQNGTENERVAILAEELRQEAEALGLELAWDSEELARFVADLHEHEHLLSAEDRAAAWHAIRYAGEFTDR
jgi:hypothetical protein